MFIVDGTGEPAPAIARLVRLMLNIESGQKLYDWGPASDSTPLAQPEPRFLTMQIPAATTGGHPMTLELKPSVGIIFYQKTPEWSNSYKLRTEKDITNFAKRLDETLSAEYSDDHLKQELPVDALLHGSFLQKGRVWSGTKILETMFVPIPQEGAFVDTYSFPARCIHAVTGPGPDRTPSHISYLAAFTWYICPIINAFTIFSENFHSASDAKVVNVAMSSIFFDTAVGGRHTPQPFHKIASRELFGVDPPPPQFAAQRGYWYGTELKSFPLLIFHNRQIHIAGAPLSQHLEGWREPVDRELDQQALPLGAKIANLGSTDLDRVCGHCKAPLWGSVYAATHPLIAPYHMAICRWCCGCLRPKDRTQFVKIDSGAARETVFQNKSLWADRFYQEMFHTSMLVAPARFVSNRETGDPYIILESLILETPETFSVIPPSLREFQLKDVRLPSVEYHRLASVDQ